MANIQHGKVNINAKLNVNITVEVNFSSSRLYATSLTVC